MLKDLLDSDVNQMEQEMKKYDREIQLAHYFPKIYSLYCLITIKLPSYFHKYITCQLLDHDIEMDSYAGPDSGADYWHCKRNCGHSGHYIYY